MAPLLQDYKFLITAKKLDNFTFNTFTFSYPILSCTSKSFSKYKSDSRKDRSAKIKISPSPGNKPLNAAGSLCCSPVSVQWKLVPNHKHGKPILKTKNIYIEIYLSTFRFILLFTSSFPFYNFLQVIGVVIRLGWVRNPRPKRGKGKGARGLDFWYFREFPGLRR